MYQERCLGHNISAQEPEQAAILNIEAESLTLDELSLAVHRNVLLNIRERFEAAAVQAGLMNSCGVISSLVAVGGIFRKNQLMRELLHDVVSPHTIFAEADSSFGAALSLIDFQ